VSDVGFAERDDVHAANVRRLKRPAVSSCCPPRS
jgi:hypothetical protein